MEQTAREIRKDFKLHGKCTLLHEAPVREFKEHHSKLFDMITNVDCNDQMLDQMLQLYTRVKSGNMNLTDGDKVMGEVAAETYVMPLVKDKSE